MRYFFYQQHEFHILSDEPAMTNFPVLRNWYTRNFR